MTFDINILVIAALAYLITLFAIAYASERQLLPAALVDHPLVYVLSLGVYASAFAYYGVTGMAQAYGLGYLNYYLGISAALFLLPIIISPLHHICKTYQLNSLADLLSFRFRSQWVGSLTTVFCSFAMWPLLAMQIQTVSDATMLLTQAADDTSGSGFRQLSALIFCLIISLFTILFGSRSLSSRDSHRGLVAALAFESLVKLVAFLCLGAAAVYGVFGGFADMQHWLTSQPALLEQLQQSDNSDNARMMLVLFFAASLCMPHVFHMLFAENPSGKKLYLAGWGLPLYLLLLSLPVLPLLWASSALGNGQPSGDYAALHVLSALDSPLLSLLVYIGGISAASGAIIVATLAIASMNLNHIVLPLHRPQRRPTDIYSWLLWTRQVLIFTTILLGYLLYTVLPDRQMLSTLAAISVAGCAQFLPGLLAVMYWPRANRQGFIAGLFAGFTLWLLGLLAPAIGFDTPGFILTLPGVTGNQTQNWMAIATLAVGINTLVMILASLLSTTSKEERSAAEACAIDDLNRPGRQALALKSAKEMRDRLTESLGSAVAHKEFGRALEELRLNDDESRPYALRRIRDRIEVNLSSLLGPSIARRVIDRSLPYANNLMGEGEDINYIEDRLEHYQAHLTGLAADLDALRRYHRQTLEDLPTGVCALASDHEILLWNKSMASITGVQSGDITGSSLSGLPPAWHKLLTDFSHSEDQHWNKTGIEVDGQPRWLNLHKTDSQLPGRDELIIVIEDITDTQLLEKELGHQERLASIGRLAAGVAHEIGNPVTGIASLAQNLRYETDDPLLLESADQIVKQTQRISSIVQSLVNFAHNGREHPTRAKEAVSIRRCVDDAVQLLQLDKEAEQVRFLNDCPPELEVAGDQQRLVQVFINLLTNARDASPADSAVHIDANTIGEKNQAHIRICDSGSGIEPQLIEQIFEPFFTTKDPGKGTGLGLALVYRIIDDLGGDISVESPHNNGTQPGTCFHIHLPLACHLSNDCPP
ncbi:ATP-binding protein [Spongiibacter sp.]|uniref:ATP-binding protein n=1 Tax=Spongiibacter sp. TaxID=2024860 RepID=UPI0035656B46